MPIAHYNLGIALQKQGNIAEAMKCFQQAIRLKPDFPEAYCELGALFQSSGQMDAALENYQMALRINPGYAVARYNLGVALNASGLTLMEKNRFDEAEDCFRKALAHQPDSAEAHNNIGGVLMLRGRFEEAAQHYQSAIDLKPDVADTYINMSNALLKQRTGIEKAIAFHKSGLEKNPDHVELHNSLGTLWQRVGQFDRAMAEYRETLKIQPTHIRAQRNLATLTNYDPRFDLSAIFDEHVKCGQLYASTFIQERTHANTPDPVRRIRIGYVSPDLRKHSVAYFLEPLLDAHNKDNVETFCYSDAQSPDSTTARLKSLSHNWRNIYNISDEKVVEMVKADGIDILVDLAGYTTNNRLSVFARKPAPIQVTYLGYPNTTGLPAMDYRLTDAWADPIGLTERYHTEALVHLPHGFLCYRPGPASPDVTPLPARAANHVTFGSFNNLTKVTPQVVAVWSSILKAVPHSRLVLKSDGLSDEKAREDYAALFAEQGVVLDRVDLLASLPSAEEHLAVYGQVDIALDPFPYNGTTTTCEALWMGIPVIILAGQSHAGRVGVSLLSQIGFAEYIAADLEEYVSIAATLANDLDRLADLRSSLRATMVNSSLCDAAAFVHDLEEAYRHMWHVWCNQSSH